MATTTAATAATKRRSRGQVLVIFAMTAFIFIGLCAVVVDVAWYWASSLRIQRAADAAALAGVIHLPADEVTAISVARAEATKNGYPNNPTPCAPNAMNCYNVAASADPANPRRLRVTITGRVGTFFAHALGVNSFPASRRSKAEYVLPVPMGSPENYYGVFGTIRGNTFTSMQTVTTDSDTGTGSGCSFGRSGSSQSVTNPPAPAAPNPAATWTTPNSANCNDDNTYGSSTTTSGSLGYWGNFGNLDTQMNAPVQSIEGIEVRVRADLAGSGTPTSSCRLDVALSRNGGQTWTTDKQTGAGGIPALSTSETVITFPDNDQSDMWGLNNPVVSDFTNANFRVRLTFAKGANCAATRLLSIDTLEVLVHYSYGANQLVTSPPSDDDLQGPGTACANGVPRCFNPNGPILNDRGFWGTMNTQGASNVNGDAFQPAWDTAGNTSAPACPAGFQRSCYDSDEFYNYVVEMPPNSSNGFVYVFDAPFCATSTNRGTGDRWFGDGSNNNDLAISSWYELKDMENTPYDLNDDTVVPGSGSGSTFTGLRASDTSMGGPNQIGSGNNITPAECRRRETAYNDGRDFHNSWYLLNPGSPLTGGIGGTLYRIHTTGTDPVNGYGSQSGANGEQSFSLYVSATSPGGQGPRIYGLGAMQMFTPLTANNAGTLSEFYLAQIEAIHAGKTVEIELWDPGDTAPLTANVQILIPTGGGYVPATLSYSAHTGTSNTSANSACNSNAVAIPPGTSQINTESNGSSPGDFNGCWLTIDVDIPTGYTAPDFGEGPGWWKIRYNMSGTGTSNDVTTWKVSIRGNPVHLVVP